MLRVVKRLLYASMAGIQLAIGLSKTNLHALKPEDKHERKHSNSQDNGMQRHLQVQAQSC